MTLCTATFEAGTNGNTVTTGDPGAATQWDAITIGGLSTLKYDSTHAYGLLSAKFSSLANAMWLEWNAGHHGTQTDDYGRTYVWRDTLDSVTAHYWLAMYDSTAAFIGRLLIDTSGKIAIQQSSGAIAATGSVTVATAQWTRLEYKIINNTSTGILEVKLFNSPNSSSPDETITATSINTRADTTTLRFGSEQVNTSGYNYYMDDIVGGAAAYPGPAPSTSQPSDDPPFGFSGRGAGW